MMVKKQKPFLNLNKVGLISILKNIWIKCFLVFTFFVPAVNSQGYFPSELSNSQYNTTPPSISEIPAMSAYQVGLPNQNHYVDGVMVDQNISLYFKALNELRLNTSNGKLLSLPKDTVFEMNLPMDELLRKYQGSQDQIMVDRSIREIFSNLPTNDFFEKKSNKIKIKESSDKEIEGKEVEATFKKGDIKNLKLQEIDAIPLGLKSDTDRQDTEGQGRPSTNCKNCSGVNDGTSIQDSSLEIRKWFAPQQINALFENPQDGFLNDYKRKMDKAIRIAMENTEGRIGGENSLLKCYKYVKDALLKALVTNPRLSGGYAKDASAQLEKQGFVNLLDPSQLKGTYLENKNLSQLITNPNLAPKRAILVYEPTDPDRMVRRCKTNSQTKRKRCYWDEDAGHIEIKTAESGKGGFVSDYYSDKSRVGDPRNNENLMANKDRKLVGVYYKID